MFFRERENILKHSRRGCRKRALAFSEVKPNAEIARRSGEINPHCCSFHGNKKRTQEMALASAD